MTVYLSYRLKALSFNVLFIMAGWCEHYKMRNMSYCSWSVSDSSNVTTFYRRKV